MSDTDSAPDRVKCRSCDRMPLRSTAASNDGLCGVCRKDKEYQELQDSRKRFLDHPPTTQDEIDAIAPPGNIENLGLRTFLMGIRPPLIDPRKSSEADFTREVLRLSTKYSSDPARAVLEFMHLCEPFAETSRPTRSRVRQIPRPYREMYALLCAWGTIGSDGFECYVEEYDSDWDSEADRALAFFGFQQSCGALGDARKMLKRYKGDLPGQLQEQLWSRFYEPIKRFDVEVLGGYLSKLVPDARA